MDEKKIVEITEETFSWVREVVKCAPTIVRVAAAKFTVEELMARHIDNMSLLLKYYDENKECKERLRTLTSYLVLDIIALNAKCVSKYETKNEKK